MLRRLYMFTALAPLFICLTISLAACSGKHSQNNALVSEASDKDVSADSKSPTSMEDKLSFYSKIEARQLSGGKGDMVHVELGVENGPCLLVCNYPGNGWFTIRCYDEHGKYLGPLLYKPGPYVGATTSLVASGTELVIEGDGDWSVDVLPLSAMTKASNGETFHGDNTVYIDANEVSEVSFSHDSEGMLSIRGVAFDSEGIRKPVTFDNLYGPTSFTEPWTFGQAVFVVEAEGDWTVAWE